MLIRARELSVEELQPKLTRRICEQDIEVLALNRIFSISCLFNNFL
jgi:hypothetical protein